MWSLLSKAAGWLFGGGTAANDVIKTGAGMLDNAFFTDQEKSAANQKLLDWYLQYQQVTSAQNVARRIIAFVVVGLWAFLVLLAVATYHWSDYSKFIFKTLSDVVNTPFEIIIGFYFAAHVVRTFMQGKPKDDSK